MSMPAGNQIAAALDRPRLDHEFFDQETRPHLGAVLLKSRLLQPEQLDSALVEQRVSRRRLGEILVERGWLFPQDIARALASQHGLDYVDIQYSSVEPRAAATLKPEIGQRLCAIPVRFLSDGSILVALATRRAPGSTRSARRCSGRSRSRLPKRATYAPPGPPSSADTDRDRGQIDVSSPADAVAFADYLRRLGCTVFECASGCVIATVTFPETVDDESTALSEWSDAWSRPGRRAFPPRTVNSREQPIVA